MKITELEKILAIDCRLSDMLKEFDVLASSMKFKRVGNLLDEDLVAKQSYPGIYLIEVNTRNSGFATLDQWIDTFQRQWRGKKYELKFAPNPHKRHIDAHLELGKLNEWMPIYIGKSLHVDRRLKEHVKLPLEKRTFAMKLEARKTMISRQWRFQTINLKGIQSYDVIAPKIESAMRNRHHPIVGRQ